MEKLVEHLGDEVPGSLATLVGGGVCDSSAPGADAGDSSSVMLSDECELDALLGRDFFLQSFQIKTCPVN